MFKHFRPAWAEVNLDNLANNMREIKKISKSKDIIAVVKADAYGHGAIDTAPVFLENGATKLAVAVISEAVELRESGINCPIMILGFTSPYSIDDLLKYNIEQTVYSYEYACEISKKAAAQDKTAKIHIALDTGMGRIGFMPQEQSLDEVYKISKLPNIIIEGLFSHFSTADEKDKSYTYTQIKKFNWFYDELSKKGIKINMRHIANSAAIIDMPGVHFDAVRPGIILYGYYPSKDVSRNKISLKPAMSLKTNVIHVKKVKSGEYIGYGRKFKTSRESLIATLPIGYADGYTRLLFNKAKVIINGKFASVVGNICMDQCMIDVTEVKDVKIGDEVILMGSDGSLKFDADNIADLLGTISYEITCMVSKRVPRVYIRNGKIIKVRNYM